MRRFLVPLLLLALAACANEQTVPLAAPVEQPAPGVARMLPVVPIRWESVPDVPEEAGAREAGAPVSLTASDGEGLQIQALGATAVIEDPLAFTEIHFVFKNPAPAHDRGALRDHPPAERHDQPLRHAAELGLAGGRGRRAPGRARGVRGRAPPPDRSGAAREAGGQPLPGAGCSPSPRRARRRSSSPTRRSSPARGTRTASTCAACRASARSTCASSTTGTTIRPRPGASRSSCTAPTSVPDHDFALPLPRRRGGRARHPPGEVSPSRASRRSRRPRRIPSTSLLVLFDTSASRALGFRGEVERLGRLIEAIKASAAGAPCRSSSPASIRTSP